MPHSFGIGDKEIGTGHPTFIIAEMAWSHDGSTEKAKKIGQAAADANADALNVHITSVSDWMVAHYGNPGTVSAGKPTSNIRDYLQKINLSPEDWQQVIKEVRKTNLALCVMPNDFPSLEFCTSLSPDAYVLAAACFVEEDFVEAIGKKKKPVILRIGGATLGEIEQTVSLLRKVGAENLLLLHGIQVYPTSLEETHINFLPVLRDMFDCQVGLADHIDGGEDLALTIPPLALGVGAVCLEKHITWDRAERGEDFESALDPPLFAKFVRYVRATEKALGMNSVPPITAAVAKYRQVSRKRAVAARDIPEGKTIESADIICKRSDEGVFPNERPYIIGRKLRKAISQDEAMTFDILD